MKRTLSWLLLIALIAAPLLFAAPPEPIEQIKEPITTGLAILKDPKYAGGQHQEEQREKIWNLVKEVFDFRAVSMRAVARNWRAFSDQQKEDFITEFKELLKNTYLDQLQGEWTNEEVIFKGQDKLTDDKALVRTVMMQGKVEVPIDYSVFLKDGKWWVYDVNIEGVSLVKNYRTQFKEILAKNSPDELIQRLKEKNQEHRRNRTEKSAGGE